MTATPTLLGIFGSWQLWAPFAAMFAAATAILAKIGVEGIHSDMATLVRTWVVVALSAGLCTRSVDRQLARRRPHFLRDDPRRLALSVPA